MIHATGMDSQRSLKQCLKWSENEFDGTSSTQRKGYIVSNFLLVVLSFTNYFNIKHLFPKFGTWVGKRLFFI